MAKHHPDIHLLTEFSAGCLPPSIALCVSAHLEFCTQCRNQVEKLDELGGNLLNRFCDDNHAYPNATATAGLSGIDSALSKTLAAIDTAIEDQQKTASDTVNDGKAPASAQYNLPKCLQKLTSAGLSQLGWKKIGSSLRIAYLNSGDTQREVSLQELCAGGSVAGHDHRGQEITMVLSGSFSDQNGLYMAGDFLVKQAGESHSPTASEDMDCLCLSVLESPVRFTGPLMRLINPFLKIYPSRESTA